MHILNSDCLHNPRSIIFPDKVFHCRKPSMGQWRWNVLKPSRSRLTLITSLTAIVVLVTIGFGRWTSLRQRRREKGEGRIKKRRMEQIVIVSCPSSKRCFSSLLLLILNNSTIIPQIRYYPPQTSRNYLDQHRHDKTAPAFKHCIRGVVDYSPVISDLVNICLLPMHRMDDLPLPSGWYHKAKSHLASRDLHCRPWYDSVSPFTSISSFLGSSWSMSCITWSNVWHVHDRLACWMMRMSLVECRVGD